MILIASRILTHKFERVPSVMPARLPAAERSWQGDPPVMMSTVGMVSQSTLVTSPWLGTSGQWWARIFDGAASYSTNHAGVAPVTCSTAMSSPPYPLKSEPILNSCPNCNQYCPDT